MDIRIRICRLLVDALDAEAQLHEGAIDVYRFFEQLTIDTRLSWSLRPGQVNDVQLGNGLDIFTQFLRLDLDDEDAMTSGTLIVLRRLAYHPVRITNKQQVKSIFLVFGPMNR